MAVGQACPQGTTSLSRSQSALMPTTMVMTRMKVSVMTLSWGCCGQWSQALGLCTTLKTHTRANCVEVFQDYQTTMQRIVRWGTHELINTTMLWPYSRWGAPVGPHMRPNRAVLALLTAPYPLSTEIIVPKKCQHDREPKFAEKYPRAAEDQEGGGFSI